MSKKFVELDYWKVLEFSQVFGLDMEEARDVLTYISERNILYSWNPDEYSDDELQEAFEAGWEAACEQMPSMYDAPEYRRPKRK